MTFGILILLIFLLAAVLMFLRKLPALLALPLMAVAIATLEVAAGRLEFRDLTLGVIADGAIRLADPIVISMFGGMISLLMQKSGVAESFVKKGAELAGDNPLVVAVVMLAIIATLFTTIGGLGAVIMVGTIVLPILASIGVKEHISAGLILFGISLGGLLNANNWAVYTSVLEMDRGVVSSYALMLFGLVAVMAVVFLAFELWRSRRLRLKPKAIVRIGAVGVVVVSVAMVMFWFTPAWLALDVPALSRTIGAVAGLLLLGLMVRDAIRTWHRAAAPSVAWYAYLIPVIPLFLILLYDVPYVPAFIGGLLYGVLATFRKGSLNLLTRSAIDGSSSVIPAVVLMIGIGMLLSAILGPTSSGPGAYWHAQEDHVMVDGGTQADEAVKVWPVLEDMQPLLRAIVPETFLGYVLVFTLLGPLALYRGPLNVWGLGYGVGGVLLATGVAPGAVMGILMSLGIIQGVSDPTNTQNVWIANEVRLDVNVILWRTIPYSWIVAALGLVVAGIRFVL
jgi:hypothetical protein